MVVLVQGKDLLDVLLPRATSLLGASRRIRVARPGGVEETRSARTVSGLMEAGSW